MTAASTTRDADFLRKFRPPELRDLHPELYAAVAREAQRIAAFEWRRRRVESSIARARADIAAGTFPCSLAAEYSYWAPGRSGLVTVPARLQLHEHEPVTCVWMVDVASDETGLASLDRIYAISRQHHAVDCNWSHISRAGVIGALRSNSCSGLVERAYPRVWRLTPLGRELMEVVFDA